MCKYCNDQEPIMSRNDITLCIKKDTLVFKLKDGWEHSNTPKIRFCPFCGENIERFSDDFSFNDYDFFDQLGNKIDIDKEFSLTNGNTTIHQLRLRKLITSTNSGFQRLNIFQLNEGVYILHTNGQGVFNNNGSFNLNQPKKGSQFIANMIKKQQGN